MQVGPRPAARSGVSLVIGAAVCAALVTLESLGVRIRSDGGALVPMPAAAADVGAPAVPIAPTPWPGGESQLRPAGALAVPSTGTIRERLCAVLAQVPPSGYRPGLFQILAPIAADAVPELVALVTDSRPRTPELIAMAGMAAQALADLRAGDARSALQARWRDVTEDRPESVAFRDALASALHRLGDTAPLQQTLEELTRAIEQVDRNTAVPLRDRLADRLVDAGRYDEAVAVLAEIPRPGSDGGCRCLTNIARVHSRAGRIPEALEALRTAAYDSWPLGVVHEWCSMGDLHAVRSDPEFPFLCAAALVRGTVVGDTHRHSRRVRTIVGWLQDAAARGYRVTDPGVRVRRFPQLLGEPHFERAWAALAPSKQR